jgi:glutathione synthase/RimK-type ligase-like ATP-grasp enzyme
MIKIGIHHRKGSYSEGWIDYCNKQSIAYKIVNAYHTDIVKQLEDCDVFMWHHHHGNPKDALFAKQLLFSLEQSGKKVYPDTASTWHFDDKLGQKYLLEALKLPLIPSFAFYTKNEALDWASRYRFPAVFKLRGGSGSSNVRLVKSTSEAVSLINKAFGKGFRQYDPVGGVKESIRKYKKGKVSFIEVLRAMAHLVYPYQLEKAKGRERGYAYFQKFIPDCKFDIRVQFVHNRCYAMKRYVTKNDFRVAGGGDIDYDGSKIPLNAVSLAFDIARKLKMQTLALDLIPYKESYLLTEISCVFAIDEGECDFGYWDSDLIWHSGAINPYGWMVELVLKPDCIKN